MDKAYLISFEECCRNYKVELNFITSLEGHGLLEPMIVEEQKYLEPDRLRDLERWITLHYDMDINMEGMEVISRLLQRIKEMQSELRALRNLVNQ